MTVMAIAAMSPTVGAQDVQRLEKDIETHEKNIKQNEEAIRELQERIEELKSQIKDLESQKKALEKELKSETKMRKEKFATRDDLVYEQEIADVLYNPYNKADVDEALRSFEGMETKEVMKKKELVEKYGEYTKDLKEFMEKMKKQLSSNKWKYLSSTSDLYKKFEKELKGTKYWKVYDKRTSKPYRSIGYLDEVMDSILILERQGFNNQKAYDRVVDMLYGSY